MESPSIFFNIENRNDLNHSYNPSRSKLQICQLKKLIRLTWIRVWRAELNWMHRQQFFNWHQPKVLFKAKCVFLDNGDFWKKLFFLFFLPQEFFEREKHSTEIWASPPISIWTSLFSDAEKMQKVAVIRSRCLLRKWLKASRTQTAFQSKTSYRIFAQKETWGAEKVFWMSAKVWSRFLPNKKII